MLESRLLNRARSNPSKHFGPRISMKNQLGVHVVFACLLLSLTINVSSRGDQPASVADATSEDGFVTLFDGQSLDGWTGAVDGYEVVDGAIQCKAKHGGNLYTKEVYGDFVVRLEFQLPPRGNNGLAIRFPGKGDPAYVGMCELQVLDNTHPDYANLDDRQFHGSAYGMAAAKRGALKPVGQWNEQEVTVIGSTIRVVLNGQEILNTDLSKIDEYLADRPHPGKDRVEGHFGFAGHGDAVKFRNVRIKSL
ncbi:hypothetical protein Pan14r_39750 [Crateriforma conspicua]|uniref:3-keto-alpha-glucoside-1,2-lyase/3-keto-2-hydroxy-glucal hydratase domain-containing protein n=2 Tax=Crateriforma conspicua TaxID=2527996 RepID=A0A5C5Y8Z7_9PLAN|nr:hypothetical protein Pan14r_39750 [Crateriforma conspicua]